MLKMRVILVVLGVWAVGTSQPSSADAEDQGARNLTIMVEAARKLELSEEADGHAYLLEKQETVKAPVAIIFGYVDNAAACEEIATILTSSSRAGTFKCIPIY